jgi:hypothetical protein
MSIQDKYNRKAAWVPPQKHAAIAAQLTDDLNKLESDAISPQIDALGTVTDWMRWQELADLGPEFRAILGLKEDDFHAANYTPGHPEGVGSAITGCAQMKALGDYTYELPSKRAANIKALRKSIAYHESKARA